MLLLNFKTAREVEELKLNNRIFSVSIQCSKVNSLTIFLKLQITLKRTIK